MNQRTLKWHIPPAYLKLRASDIHIWSISSEKPYPFLLENMTKFLSSHELLKAKQLLPVQQKHYIIRHYALRCILSRYLGIRPDYIQFHYGQHEKPKIKGSTTDEQTMFNVSHSHNLNLIAVTKKKNVGIDLEYIRANLSLSPLINHFFTKAEISKINSLPPEQRTIKTFILWTHKEAYIKARGLKISAIIESDNRTNQLCNSSKHKNTKYERKYHNNYSKHTFTPDSNYIATVASQHTKPRLHYWQWSPQHLIWL